MPPLRKYELYLSGGGDENQSFPLDSFFFEKIPSAGNFLYIPIALRGHKLYATAALWMKKILAMHKREDVTFELWNSLEGKTYVDVAPFDAIYVGGGNTWSLMKEIKAANFQGVIAQFVKEKGPVYGGSAGAIIIGKRIDTHDDENIAALAEADGFGILGNYSVACHFKEEQTERFREWSLSHREPILCLPEETGLIINTSDMRCVGTKSCTIFASDGTFTNLSAGEHVTFTKE